ncbi:MAG: hypothetical protein L0H73_03220 [Nitrococcus sp.]|nr:hypothetical protein [Nitrococcus sp.]
MNSEATNGDARRAEANAGIDAIESKLAANRAALDRTLSELEQRISLGGLANLAMGSLRNENGSEFVRNLRDSVVHNPLPITLAAIGLAWTAFSDGNGRAGSAGLRLGNARQKSAAATDQLRAAKERNREWAERSGEVMANARERAGELGSNVAGRTRRSMEQSRDLARENPIIVAGTGLVLGAALAALFPATQLEREKLGPVRDSALRQAQGVAAAAGKGAKESASEAIGWDQPRQTESPPLGTSGDGVRGGRPLT